MQRAATGRQHGAGAYEAALAHLRARRYHWLITGVAGFIGSHLLETLLRNGQQVTGIDNFITGHWRNLQEVQGAVGPAAWEQFDFIEGDIRSLPTCRAACTGVDFVLHQAALGSVPRSIEDPLLSSEINIIGFLNILIAARDDGVQRLVYAASSATYGDHPGLPKVEQHIGQPLSPYGVSKYSNELHAAVFARCYGLASIGLRYFNVFGPRQDPHGPYAAVIPQWFSALVEDRRVTIHGDGSSSRDFCYVANAVQANVLAALTDQPGAVNQVYNVAVNDSTSLNQLFQLMRQLLAHQFPALSSQLDQAEPHYTAFRQGDVRHSQADISKAARLLGYAPTHRIGDGLELAAEWYWRRLQ